MTKEELAEWVARVMTEIDKPFDAAADARRQAPRWRVILGSLVFALAVAICVSGTVWLGLFVCFVCLGLGVSRSAGLAWALIRIWLS